MAPSAQPLPPAPSLPSPCVARPTVYSTRPVRRRPRRRSAAAFGAHNEERTPQDALGPAIMTAPVRTRNPRMPRRTSAVLLGALFAATAAAQVPAPPPPETYNVRIRYEINALGLDRIAAYED